MQINGEEIAFCLEKAKWMQEQYRLYAHPGDRTPVSIDEFLRICKDELSIAAIEIKRIPLDGNSKSIRSAFTIKDTGMQIYILDGQDQYWKRFVLAKELFHVLLDKDEYHNMEIYQHLEEVSLTWFEAKPASKSAVCEQLAEIAAMEFMFPYDRRVHERQTEIPDYQQIADHYEIPRVHVEKYLTDAVMHTLAKYMLKSVTAEAQS